MRRIKTCTLVLSVAVISAALWGCGRSAADSGTEAEAKEQSAQARDSRADKDATAAAERAEPPPPDDYVRSRCTVCSCRVFTGSTGLCSRPTCYHGWKDHRSQLQD